MCDLCVAKFQIKSLVQIISLHLLSCKFCVNGKYKLHFPRYFAIAQITLKIVGRSCLGKA